MGERTIILHYHLFKNAGTSVDAILKSNFPGRWVTREFPGIGGNNTALVEDWIRETPDAVAYSSHTMMGPLPQVEGVRIISCMLLRDPIERIKSAYRFERTQTADTWGAQLAKTHDFEGYVRARLAREGDRQCQNFQTYRLASMMPGAGPELERAIRALKALTVVSLVSNFAGAMEALSAVIASPFSGFTWKTVHANSSSKHANDGQDALDALLAEVNTDDLKLLDEIRRAKAVARSADNARTLPR
jgi:hypothetical protein